MANLHLDEVTGEKVSKSELKKRNKQRQKEEREKAKGSCSTSEACCGQEVERRG